MWAGGQQIRCLLITLSIVLAVVRGGVLEKHSFSSPFMAHDHRGSRFVPHWNVGGDLIVKQSFMRLTSDKPNQMGHIWSRQSLPNADFSLIIKFRVSGSQEKLYGESLALYIGRDAAFVPGSVYGMKDGFTGVMIVLDTNSADEENPAITHRDVSVLVNGNHLSRDQVLYAAEGCAASLRYHEARDDFNVLKGSRLRVRYDATAQMLDLEVDARNTGRWRRCTRMSLAGRGLPPDWALGSHVGVLARTSSAASDNHDVLSLRMFDNSAEAAQQEREEGLGDDQEDDYMVLVHHMEHELYQVHSSLQKTLDDLRTQEKAAEARIKELEEQLSKQVLSKLDQRLQHLESRVRSNVDTSVKSRLEHIERRTSERFSENVKSHVQGVSNSWRKPFIVLFILLSVVMLAAFKQYKSLKRASRMY